MEEIENGIFTLSGLWLQKREKTYLGLKSGM